MPSRLSTRIVRAKIQNLERYINKQRYIPATEVYRTKVVLPLFSKALTVGRAICLLVDEGFPSEAFAMSRTLLEMYFYLRYMSNKDTEKRITAYVEYFGKTHEAWGEIAAKYYPNKAITISPHHKELMALAKKFKSKHYWSDLRGQFKFMALEEDTRELDKHGHPFKSDFDYEVIYFWTSQYVHVTILALNEHASERGAVFKVRPSKHAEDKRGITALFNVLFCLSKIFVCGYRIIHEDQPEEILQDIHRTTKRYARLKKRGMPKAK